MNTIDSRPYVDPRRAFLLSEGGWSGALALGLTLAGLGLGGAHIVYGLMPVTALIVAILLMTIPVVWHLLTAPVEQAATQRGAIMLVMLSGILVRYLYALTDPFLAGTDAPFHYFHAQEVAAGQWPSNNQISGAWPLLYLLSGTLARVTSIPLAFVAVWLYPLLNIATIYLVFIYLRGLIGARGALLATFIYTWEYTSFYFGFEFRTQSLAVFFFALYLAIRASHRPDAPQARQLLEAAVGTATLVAIGLTAAVSSILTTLLLGAFVVGEALGRRLGLRAGQRIGSTAPMIVITVMLCYLIYNVRSMEAVVPYTRNLIWSALSFELINDANLKGVFVSGYGQFVLVLQWGLRLLFLAGIGLQLYALARRPLRASVQLGPLAATIMLLGLTTVGTLLGAGLSPGRYFQYLSPFYGLYAAITMGALARRVGAGRGALVLHMVLATGLALWCASGVLKLPAELIDPRNAARSIPARLDRETRMLAGQIEAGYPQTSSSICADVNMAGAIYALTGRAVERTGPRPEDAARCALEQAAQYPLRTVALTVDTSLSGDPTPLVAAAGFQQRAIWGPIILLEYVPEDKN